MPTERLNGVDLYYEVAGAAVTGTQHPVPSVRAGTIQGAGYIPLVETLYDFQTA